MSMVCTTAAQHDAQQRPPQQRGRRHVVWLTCCLLLLLLLLTACGPLGGESGDETIPEPTIPVQVTPSPTPVPPSPTPDLLIDALLETAPTTALPANFFFADANVLWSLTPAGGTPLAVLEVDRLGPWAQTTDATRAAATIYSTSSGSSNETVLLVDPFGGRSAPIWGPVEQPGSPGNPRIVEVSWSWFGDELLLLREDGSVLALDPNQDTAQQPRPTPLFTLPAGASTLRSLPSGAGWSFLIDDQLRMLPAGDLTRAPIAPVDADVTTYAWLPGSAQVLAVPRSGGSSGPGGSILSADARGQAMQLLVSAGQFGPSAQVGLLAIAPDGERLAFAVVAPDERGQVRFASLWSLHLISGRLQQITVDAGYRVTDLWWTSSGIIWRGVDRAAAALQGELVYAGIEPYVLGLADPMTGTSSIIVQSGALVTGTPPP